MTIHSPSARTARRVAAHVFGEDPTEAVRLLGEGELNIVFAARVSEGEFAVRLCKEGSDAAVCEQEATFLRHAALCGVSAPSVRAVGVIEGQPFLIETVAPGVPGDTLGVDTGFCWQRLGDYARRLHTITDAGSLPDAERAAYTRDAPAEWQRFVAYNLASLTSDDQLIALEVYKPEQQSAVGDVFRRLQAETFRFGVCHNDLDVRHLFVTPDGQTTLIDWGCAEINLVPHFDLMEILHHHAPDSANVTAFREGYGMTDATFADLLPQVRDLRLLKSFDLVRWAIDRRPERIGELAKTARAILADYIATS